MLGHSGNALLIFIIILGVILVAALSMGMLVLYPLCTFFRRIFKNLAGKKL